MKRHYEKLIVWQEAHNLALFVYSLTSLFPKAELFGLVSQMRRASYSVPMNIAEGNARIFLKEKLQFINIAYGSLDELHYQCRLSCDLHYITSKDFHKVNDHIQRTGFLLEKLRSSLRKSSLSSSSS
jgi:four helix bundle protein